MTFAWYAHLRNLSERPWYIAAILSWGIALFEYMLQVPANRIGSSQLSLAQLKIIQEVITLGVFVPFALLYMRQPMNWNFLWAGWCLLGAGCFMFWCCTQSSWPSSRNSNRPWFAFTNCATRCRQTCGSAGLRRNDGPPVSAWRI